MVLGGMQEAPSPHEPALPWPIQSPRLDDQALAEVAAALFYAAHDLLAAGIAEWQPRACQMLGAARACSAALEQRMNQGRARH